MDGKVIFLALGILLFNKSGHIDAKGCSVSINGDLSDPQALFLKDSLDAQQNDAFLEPIDDSGTLEFAKGDTFLVSCPGSLVELNGKPTKTSLAQATCTSGTSFKVDATSVKLVNITCTKHPKPILEYTGNLCGANEEFHEITMGFELDEERYFNQMTACFDRNLQSAVYTVLNQTKSIGGSQVNYPRPAFKEAGFFDLGKTKVDQLYQRNTQRKAINEQLGLDETDDRWIHKTNDYYLARGHLAAKTDFLYGQQQRLTFHFVNAAPQWQTLNAGNWLSLETSTRDYASDNQVDLIVYTGIHGVCTLPHAETGELTELYLFNEDFKAIPVPELFWKVVYNPETRAGIAFVAVNNPYLENYVPICEDTCGEIDWVSWNTDDQKSGYAYCCDVNDFRETVTALPDFIVKSLLK